MLRFWMLAVLFIGATSEVVEARDRHRVTRNQGVVWQYRYPVRYTSPVQYSTPVYSSNSVPSSGTVQSSNGVTQASHSSPVVSAPVPSTGSPQIVQPASYASPSPAYVGRDSALQAWAEEEARMMASRGTCGHIRPAPSGCFVGVGCGMTCMGSGRLVAEAHYQGKMVRVWQR